jgi:NifU-like protein
VAQSSEVTTNSGQAGPHSDEATRLHAIRKVIDQDIRPYVQADGGDIELVALEGNRVKVRLLGACVSCPSSLMTLHQGVQTRLQAMVSPDLIVEEVNK